jgi:hypothetical protein
VKEFPVVSHCLLLTTRDEQFLHQSNQALMYTSQFIATVAAGLATLSYAQQSQDNNAAVDILSCTDLDQVDVEAGAVCAGDQIRAIGVGIAPDVFTINDTSLSLTLVDNGHEGGVGSGYQQSKQELYVGAPSDLDISEHSPACALMLQYQGQTFPNITGPSDNTTSCADIFSGSCLDTLTDVIQAFEYEGSNATASDSAQATPTRCDLLARHVHDSLLSNVSFCGLWSSFLNVTGGPIFGFNASTQLQESAGQPVSPSEYELHQAASMTQLFRPGGDEFPDADSEANEELSEPVRGAGRQGTTPVVGVFYTGEGESEPVVQYACMRTFSPAGEELPNQLNYPTSGAAGKGVGYAGSVLAVVHLVHMLL